MGWYFPLQQCIVNTENVREFFSVPQLEKYRTIVTLIFSTSRYDFNTSYTNLGNVYF